MSTERVTISPRLLPGEKVVHIEDFRIRKPEKHPNTVPALKLLTGVTRYAEVGTNGPAVASRATEENEGVDGLGLFEAPFGRDSLTVALLLKEKHPPLINATIKKAAELQGVNFNFYSEEEPGKIFHEDRHPDDHTVDYQRNEAKWEFPYYGSVDSTPLFIQGVHAAFTHDPDYLNNHYEGRDTTSHTIEYALDKAVGWIEKVTTPTPDNPEGLLEFKRINTIGGITNQAWKDSGDSYMHADGALANHEKGIASIEVQSQLYDARIDAAEIYEQLSEKAEGEKRAGYLAKASKLREGAAHLRKTVIEKFWVEDERGGYFALGTDRDNEGNLRQLKVRTSNMGRLLNSRILEGDDPETVYKRDEVIKTLFSPEMLAASGIRTLSNKEARFRPGAYHNGSVWLFDTYLIAQGLERHGFYGLAEDLKGRLGAVVAKYHKFPEFARGGDEDEPMLNERIIDVVDENTGLINRIEQPPQEIQAWSVAAILAEKLARNPLKAKKEPKPLIALDVKKRQLEETLLPTRLIRAA